MPDFLVPRLLAMSIRDVGNRTRCNILAASTEQSLQSS